MELQRSRRRASISPAAFWAVVQVDSFAVGGSLSRAHARLEDKSSACQSTGGTQTCAAAKLTLLSAQRRLFTLPSSSALPSASSSFSDSFRLPSGVSRCCRRALLLVHVTLTLLPTCPSLASDSAGEVLFRDVPFEEFRRLPKESTMACRTIFCTAQLGCIMEQGGLAEHR